MNYPAQKTSLIHTLGFKSVYPSVLIQVKLTRLPDLERLKRALSKLIETIPRIACRYDYSENCFYPAAGGIIQLIDAEDNPYGHPLDFLHQPQLKIYLKQHTDSAELILIGSHILSDATGFKQLLYALIALYNQPFDLGTNQLNELDVYQRFCEMPLDVRRSDLSAPLSLPFAEEEKRQSCKMAHRVKLSKAELKQLKAFGEQRGFTLNDSLLAGYMRFLFKYNPDHSQIQLACPTDTRQFLTEKGELRIGNYTARYNPIVAIASNEKFWESVEKVHVEMKLLKENHEFFESVQPLFSDSDRSISELRDELKQTYHPRDISYTNMMVIDKNRLNFEDAQVLDVFMSGAFRKAPKYQVCFNTFDQQLNLVCTVEGNKENQQLAHNYLQEIKQELLAGLEEN